MNTKTDKKIFAEALKNGCTTVAQLAYFLKVRELVARTYENNKTVNSKNMPKIANS